ncbi:MAG: MarR family transcriptional regulator [Microbacterium sp.]|nr:MarR family transcriptional regulator [Microbacterium sp.]
MSDQPSARESAMQINQLIVDLWLATEGQAPRPEDFELTGQQHAVLEQIAADPSITPGLLADRLGVSKGAISQHLTALESSGHITRTRSPQDGRVQVLQLGRRGEEYRESMNRYEQYMADTAIEKLSAADLAEIVAALRKLKSAFATEG